MPTAVLTRRATTIPTEPAADDAVLLRRYSDQGDAEALDALFRRHSDAAYRVALRCCQNSNDAEDAVQTAFLKILRDARQFQGKASVRGWIMSIVVNSCRMKNREEAQRRKREESAAAPSAPPEAGLAAVTAEEVAAALKTVQTLPDLYRMPVWLHYVEGYGYDEVAEALEIKEKTVREQARRGLEQVRQAMAAAGFAAGAAAVPELLSKAVLPAAPAALVASFKGLIAAGAAKAAAPVTVAASSKTTGSAFLGMGGVTMKITACVVLAAAATTAAVVSSNRRTADTAKPVPKIEKPAGEEKTAAPTKGNDKAPLGSPEFYPSPERPIGWRGDGSGCYPGANPPTTWSRNDAGEKKNILWEVKMPCYSWAMPVIVGDRLFVRSDPYDMVCMDKNTGKLLWIRSHPPFVAVTEEEKMENPAFKEIEPLVAELQKINDAFVASGWTQELYDKKYKLQKDIDKLTAKADKKYALPPDRWVESWSGYTAQTPVSDGLCVYFTSGVGITGCYDLDGNLKWRRFASLVKAWGEHGDGISPALAGDKLMVAQNLHALDTKTGKEIWKMDFKPKGPEQDGEGLGMIRVNVGGTEFVTMKSKLVRLSDGKPFGQLSWVFAAPIVHGDMLYNVHQGGCLYYNKLESMPNGEAKVTSMVNGEYNGAAFPLDDPKKKYDPMTNFWVPSPLYHDGLIYCLSSWGKLIVATEKATKPDEAVVLNRNLPFDFKNPKHRKTWGCGIGASVAMAGKYIYVTDNAGCTLVLEPGREYKLVAKNNIDHMMVKGWEQGHWNDNYHEVTLSTPIFDGNRIYLRGEQNMYCIAEK